MALKPANLEKESTLETYKAQHLSEYHEKAWVRCQPYTLEQVAGFVALCLGLSFYSLGFSMIDGILVRDDELSRGDDCGCGDVLDDGNGWKLMKIDHEADEKLQDFDRCDADVSFEN
eukprot:CAMPEP_0197185868 /NCGR_PEP_ID=MMETSP1423-20130617/12822_1 /TAXON_ID=476441 /ORGANISM="Pseudo-nitzschia heimii, Strain UNC1101" /LENGTH=116 /DNA_ID=CAMNT_0042637031 /DNA_START=571 /DNA_END=922 /DNA_ORIENTATION=-